MPTLRGGAKGLVKRTVRGILLKLLQIRPTALNRFVTKRFQLWYRIPVPPTHYYSPLPDIPIVKKKLSRWYREGNFEAIEWNLDKQRSLLGELEAYKEECDSLPPFDGITAEDYGQGYGEVEAHFLHCMVRHLKPHKIIEVGSGVSTYFALNAAQLNRQKDKVDLTMFCIEPCPSRKLQELANQKKLVLHAQEVQDVEVRVFKSLEEGDILFIDSSHVSKVDSDVNWLYFEVLPNLQKGVVIHIHDIPFPYLTCMPEHPLFDYSLLWNEAALVRAFLMYNRVFKVILCQSYLHYKYPNMIKRVVSIYDEQKHFPSSLWLVKGQEGMDGGEERTI